MIRYASILNESMVDGLGLRVVAFLQGCVRHCEGCHNPDLLPMTGGTELDEREFAKLLLGKINILHQGITFSGGDPLAQSDSLGVTLSVITQKNPQLDIWVYTGFLFEEVKHLPVMKYIDVMIDGPFEIDKKDLKLPFRGSTNQRIIDVKKSLSAGKLVEFNTRSEFS